MNTSVDQHSKATSLLFNKVTQHHSVLNNEVLKYQTMKNAENYF